MGGLVRQVKGYPTSTDYAALWEIAHRQAVVCLVEHRPRHRWPNSTDINHGVMDVAQTVAMPDDSGKVWCVDISCRGISYVQGFGLPDFVEQCERASVQWLVPHE